MNAANASTPIIEAPGTAGANVATHNSAKPRRPLFQKYFSVLFAAVVLPLLASGASEAWFGYRDQTAMLDQILGVQAQSAAGRIQAFLDGIKDELGWTVQLPWATGADERHRFDVLRLLRQVPAIVDVILVDGDGVERLHISRVAPDIVGSGIDRSKEPAVEGARAARIWYGPVTLHQGSEPYMTIAAAGTRASAGVVIAEINLKLIWDVISAIKIGDTGEAFVADRPGHLVAHPDMSLVLRGNDNASAAMLREMQAATSVSGGEPVTTTDIEHRRVLAAMAPVAGPDWVVFVVQPVREAFAPIREALWRTGLLLLAGALFAATLAYWLAHRMAGPIRLLGEGAAQIGAGQFDHRINISTGDELEGLADRFNHMAGELAISQERSERINRLKRFLAPQVAELVERSGHETMLDGHRAEVVVVFCDLRGFTAFAGKVSADELMGLVREYYEALGAIITTHEATLTNLSGDGLMMLLNAPVPCPEPSLRAARMAIAMQDSLQRLIVAWRQRGYTIGFGIGLAKGMATVGRIGYEGRLDYTAIGSVTNLASRICSVAEDGEILLDQAAAVEVRDILPLRALGERELKGFAKGIPIFAIEMGNRLCPENGAVTGSARPSKASEAEAH